MLSACQGAPVESQEEPTFAIEDQSLRSSRFTPAAVAVPGLTEGFAVEQLAERTFVMRAYSNAVVTDTGDGLIIVDTMSPDWFSQTDGPNMQATIAALAAQGRISTTSVKAIAYTHWHPDHIGQSERFRGENTQVLGARGTKMRLSSPQVVAYFSSVAPQFPAAPQPAWPTAEVANEAKLGRDATLRYTPYSHTLSDLVIWLPKEAVVVIGDMILQGWLAFTDVDNGGSMRGLVRSVDAVLAATPSHYNVVPGHNAVMSKREAKEWIDAIRAGTAWVGARVAQGLSLEQIQALAAEAPAETRALDGQTFPLAAFIGFVYEDFTRRDEDALLAARYLAAVESVSTREMVRAIKLAIDDRRDAAGIAYDTLALVAKELQAQALPTDGANRAFAIYEGYVNAARAAGRSDLTADEHRALLKELHAL